MTYIYVHMNLATRLQALSLVKSNALVQSTISMYTIQRERERERESARGRDRRRERETQNHRETKREMDRVIEG